MLVITSRICRPKIMAVSHRPRREKPGVGVGWASGSGPPAAGRQLGELLAVQRRTAPPGRRRRRAAPPARRRSWHSSSRRRAPGCRRPPQRSGSPARRGWRRTSLSVAGAGDAARAVADRLVGDHRVGDLVGGQPGQRSLQLGHVAGDVRTTSRTSRCSPMQMIGSARAGTPRRLWRPPARRPRGGRSAARDARRRRTCSRAWPGTRR